MRLAECGGAGASHGSSCDIEAIGSLHERYGFAVLEDASHAICRHYQDELLRKRLSLHKRYPEARICCTPVAEEFDNSSLTNPDFLRVEKLMELI